MKISTEIVVPVHDRSRPIRRAVESVLKDPESRALVIAHNIEPEVLDLPSSDRVRVLPLNAAPGMPGATFDFGIANAEAEWVGIMGSDDWYQDGGIAQMRERAHQDRADGVISPLRHQLQNVSQIKPLTMRTKNLDAVRDRMFYRTAPLGIFRTQMMQDPRYRFGDVFPQGSDMRVTALLWTSGHKFSYYADDPAYVVGKDAKTRVTFTPRPLEASGAPMLALFDEPGVKEFSASQKHALATKMARVHVHSAVILRQSHELWLENDVAWLAGYVKKLREFDPHFDRPMNRRDRSIMVAVERGDLDEIIYAARGWGSHNLFDRVFPQNPAAAVTERDSNLRWAITAAGVRLRGKAQGYRSRIAR